VRSPSSDALSTEALAFLQHRVALFGLVGGGLGLFFLVFLALFYIGTGMVHMLGHPPMLYHLAGAASLLAVWALCRSGIRSRRFVDWVEAVGLVASCLFYAAMGSHMPFSWQPDREVLLTLFFGLMARAIYVPSTATRTLVLALVIGLLLLPVAYAGYLRVDAATLEAMKEYHVEEGEYDAATFYAWSSTVMLAVWWSLIVFLTTAASKVLYGLRREVRQARRLGQYLLEEKIGEGGMGVVYRAAHAMLRRPTAVKLLLPERSSEKDVLRFEREVQLTARLTHPNTVTVFDYGRTSDGVFYYAMELLDGAPLDVAVRAVGPFAPERVLHVLHEVAGALTEAHGIGLIHRDLKPSNIILCERGGVPDVAKVVDFGLVKELGNQSDVALTQAEALTGTPLYMSPESIREPASMDARSDLYSLGAVGYFLLTGGPVFSGKGVVEVCAHHLHTTPEPPSRRRADPVPGDLERILLDCLAKSPASRPESAAALCARLESCDGFGTWTSDRAREWWRLHAEALAEQKARPESVTAWTALSTQSRWSQGDSAGG
jgi:serine/threonine-protein kinase